MISHENDEICHVSRLVLGTAQLGMPYGIANRSGQPDFKTAIEIIKTAWKNGIREFDTAQAYGISESILGKALSALGISREARIVTKLDPELNPLDDKEIKKALERSLERLHVPSLHGLMLHREEWLEYQDEGLNATLKQFVDQGLTSHLGVSLYSPLKSIRALESDLFDMIQVPANILDRRFENVGVFQLADEKGTQVYIRSVFLQGLLVMKPDELSYNMAFSKPVLRILNNLCKEHGLTQPRVALLYVKQKYLI